MKGVPDTYSAIRHLKYCSIVAVAVITYGSSFGYVATALALRPPHYQQHLYQDNVYQVRCHGPCRCQSRRPISSACAVAARSVLSCVITRQGLGRRRRNRQTVHFLYDCSSLHRRSGHSNVIGEAAREHLRGHGA